LYITLHVVGVAKTGLGGEKIFYSHFPMAGIELGFWLEEQDNRAFRQRKEQCSNLVGLVSVQVIRASMNYDT